MTSPSSSPPGSTGDPAAIQRTLAEADLVDSETVVVCRRTKTQIARFPFREAIQRLSAEGVKCACGIPLADEAIEDAAAPNDRLRKLLDGARWFSLIVIEALVALGVPRDRIAIEQQVGGDEIDCVADVSGELVLFELKDKEFNLGNAYSFGAKIGLIRPEHPVVVTTEHVGGDAREHFSRVAMVPSQRNAFVLDEYEEGPRELLYIEGIDSLRPALDTLASGMYQRDALRVINELLPLATVDPAALIASLSRQEQEAPVPRPRRRRRTATDETPLGADSGRRSTSERLKKQCR